MDQYNKLFLPAINVNICDTIQKNIDMLSPEIAQNIDIKGCKEVYDGVM